VTLVAGKIKVAAQKASPRQGRNCGSGNNVSCRDAHWAKTRNLTITILILWFIFSFVVHWFAESLNAITFMGFPLGYYMAVQGSLIIFVVLIFVQNWIQDKIDDESGFSEEKN
jgi:putative solute:sodium symporter small subunit